MHSSVVVDNKRDLIYIIKLQNILFKLMLNVDVNYQYSEGEYVHSVHVYYIHLCFYAIIFDDLTHIKTCCSFHLIYVQVTCRPTGPGVYYLLINLLYVIFIIDCNTCHVNKPFTYLPTYTHAQPEGDGTMVKTRWYDGENAMVRW